MRITEYPGHLELCFDNAVQLFGVCSRFSVAHPNAWHLKQKNRVSQDWDGLIAFCRPIKKSGLYSLPVGFKTSLLEFLKTENLEFELTSTLGPEPPIPFAQHLSDINTGEPLIFDDTQEAACRALLEGRRRVIELGTASGKTEIFLNAYACLRAIHPEARCAIIVPKRNLLNQTVERIYSRLGGTVKVGIVGSGKFEVDADITVATFQTACGRDNLVHSEEIKRWLPTISCLILDECHHSALAPSWQDIIKVSTPRWLWGVSAKVTFFRAKNKLKEMSLEGIFGLPAYKGFSKERTCPVTVVFHHHKSWEGKFDGKGLQSSYCDMMPCAFRHSSTKPWHEGFWRGPDKFDNVPSWMLTPRESDIIGHDTVTNCPIFKPSSLVYDHNSPTLVYNPQRLIPDTSLYGVYQQQPDQDPETKEGWKKIKTATFNIVYFNRHDVAIMEFDERNTWAVELAQLFTEKEEAWVIVVRRTRHARKIHKKLKNAGIFVPCLEGSMLAEEQQKAIEDVRKGVVHGLVAPYSIISEGTDIPNLIHIIKLDGISEEQVLEQQKGRVQRIFPGKTMGYLHIPRDNQNEFLNANCGEMVSYFKHKGIPIKKLLIQ